jgi:NAD(P)-dependent dehydrogenase (short-subunit alcohol dehydrogenase family)
MRILITGAGRAIGAATAVELTRAGHDVVATACDVAGLDDLDVALRLPLDVTAPSSRHPCGRSSAPPGRTTGRFPPEPARQWAFWRFRAAIDR